MNYLRDSAIDDITGELAGLSFSLAVLVLENNILTTDARKLLQDRIDALNKELKTYEE